MIYWVLHIIVLSVLAFLFYRKIKFEISSIIYWSALILKLSAGIILGLIYFNYYGMGDTISFHEYAKELAELPFKEYLAFLFEMSTYENSIQPRVLFFSKFLSIFSLITGGSYWISSLYLSFISFCSSWYCLSVFYGEYRHLKKILTACFLFIPTIVFWSSGVIKESIAYAALIFMVAMFIKTHHGRKLHLIEWVLSILGFYILWRVKHYILIILLIFVSITWLIKFLKTSNQKRKWFLPPVILLVLLSTQWVHPYLKIERLPQTIYENNQAIVTKTDKEDQLNIVVDSPDWISVFKVAPKALGTGLFRPSITDKTPIWGWIHRIENTILIILSITSILLVFKSKVVIDVPLISAGIFSILLLVTLLTLTTPNFGTLVRYKTVVMPFFFLITSILPFTYLLQKPINNR